MLEKNLDIVLARIRSTLIFKNKAYGSVSEFKQILSVLPATENLKVSIDDKITRIKTAHGSEDELVYEDLVGYLILLLTLQEK